MKNNGAVVTGGVIAALKCIKLRGVHDIEDNKLIFVNKLIYWGDDLMIGGYKFYKVEDFNKTWNYPKPERYVGIMNGLSAEEKERLIKILKEAIDGQSEESENIGNDTQNNITDN